MEVRVAAIVGAIAIASSLALHSLRAPVAVSSLPAQQLPSTNDAEEPRPLEDGLLLFTVEQLARTVKQQRLYLAILGDVYDVHTGAKHYAKGHSYHHFVGIDGSRAFATGEYTAEGLTDDVSGMSMEMLESIGGWHKFFAEHETYRRIGHVVGRYYDARGAPTHAFPWARIAESKAAAEAKERRMPMCNSKWSREEGAVVWCTTQSGGIERDWVGVPRLYNEAHDPEYLALTPTDGEPKRSPKPERCVCITTEMAAQPAAHFSVYLGCAPEADKCQVRKKTEGSG